ncbi:oxidoreductase [Methylobacterium sp. NEAU 140]|uniref:oxidoreductase n=1 Tax=Methylobacterium sp. NEAU 140 TaxID=3064945 RepID=UPI0027335CCD|nr:oxidoreductase [Methylobacterium sp. NEAU 140]MDP4023049.1 oxidoreductase [Methylobacterium sp. NEAU 140]
MSGPGWTAAEIPPQVGRVALVTGATSGIGYEAARALAGAGAHVVLAARDAAKAERAMAAIRAVHPQARLEARPLDTASLAAVRAFAEGWTADGRPIDVLLLNAGIASVPRREESPDGFERQLATNHLGHFALTGLLLPRVARSAASRIVAVSSLAHRSGRIAFDDPQMHAGYGPQRAYRQSKLAMLLFSLELDRRLRTAGSPVRSVPVHPGLAATDVIRRGERAGPAARLAGRALFGLLGQSAARGALPLLYAASAPGAEGGTYYGPGGPFEAWGPPRCARIAPHALDRDVAARLWSLSEALTGVRIPL